MTVTQAQANQILSESQVGKVVKEEGNKNQVVQAAVKEAAALANAVVDAVTKGEPPPGQAKQGDQGDKTTQDKGDNKPPPIVPEETQKPTSGCGGQGGNLVKNCGFETTGSLPNWDLSGAGEIITRMKDSSGNSVFKPTEGSRMGIIHTGTEAVCVKAGGCSGTSSGVVFERSVLSQTSSDVKQNKTYLITFDYNFMSNEFPHEATTFNDKFTATAKGIGSSGGDIEIVTESRNSSSFKTDKGAISSDGSTDSSFTNFTLKSGNGYTDWKSASKTVQSENVTSGTLEFKIEDIGDNDEDSAVLIDNVVVKEDPPLYEIFNGKSLAGPHQKPLVEYYDQTATFDSVLVASGSGPNGAPSVSLSGPLLKAERSNLTVPFSLLGLTYNSRLVSTSSEPLVWLNGGNYSLSTEKGTSIFDFWGTKTALDPDTGAELGTVKSLEHIGPLLEASGAATVSTQKVLKLDTALLAATAPIISLVGTPSTQSSLTTETSTIDLFKSKVTSIGPVVAMDKSFINVTNGPLISVAGAGSLLDVAGALVNFGGTGGNKIVVNNGISPTATLSGLPVSSTFGGSVSIGPNPVKNPSLGSVSVTGSLISATNGGTVSIQAK